MSGRLPAYDVAIIGGGPAALVEAVHLRSLSVRAVVLSEQFGGCMDILGELPLQSYLPELELAGAPVRLSDFMRSKTECHPTGREYADYIRASFSLLHTENRQCTVTSLRRDNDRFLIATSDAGCVVEASQVVLATGGRPRRPVVALEGGLTLSCFAAYRRLRDRDMSWCAGREVFIVGSGNTAYQLAYALVRTAKRIAILANKYVGVYPIESTDRFALRGRSVLTLELIEKTSSAARLTGPMNDRDGALAPIHLYLYDDLAVDRATQHLRARIPPVTRAMPVVANSVAAAVRVGLLSPDLAGGWALNAHLPDAVAISAIGIEANRIDCPWTGLIDEKTGFVRHTDGSTSVPGLFVTGAAAGYPSVNLMQPVFGALASDRRAGSCR